MEIKFFGHISGLEEGLQALSAQAGFQLSEEGIPVYVEKAGSNIEVSFKDGKGHIKYDQKVHFFRAVGLLVEKLKNKENGFIISEEPQFAMNGCMLDVSRNAVLKVQSIKNILSKMALMGLNAMMLYTEDTYTIENNPYFGYMRGKYSFQELKECDDYADRFGIEIIPCIQTLAHLTQALKWNYAAEIKDTPDILLVGNEKTYEFISNMIEAASAPFRSKRIHIGMDEAHNLGLGRYLDQNGYRERFAIMNAHLGRVMKITAQFGLKPMIWMQLFRKMLRKTSLKIFSWYTGTTIMKTNSFTANISSVIKNFQGI